MEKIRKSHSSYGKIMGKMVCLTGICILFFTGLILLLLSLNASHRIFNNIEIYKVEIAACIIYFVGVIGIIVGISFLSARYIGKQEKAVFEAIDHIGRQDLDFDMRYTGVKEVDALLGAIDEMKCALQDSLKQQWRLEQNRKMQISALAHDLKTPVTILKGNLYLIHQNHNTKEDDMYLKDMNTSLIQLEKYVSQLLEITRAEKGYVLNKEDTDLNKMISDVVLAFEQSAKEKNICIRSEVKDEQKINVDPKLLERALWNLVGNSMNYVPEGGTITIQACQKEKNAYLKVMDTGSGFSDEILAHGKEPFFMGDNSRNITGHYGLGLFIADSITQQHGGKMMLSNDELTGGAIVTLELPVE